MALRKHRVAIIGAGISGATCARGLADAGMQVSVFDKGRNVGGRMAARRVTRASVDGSECLWSFDHGVPAFEAQSPEFTAFLGQAQRSGWIDRWIPTVASAPEAEAEAVRDAQPLWVPTPDMPSLCRSMLDGIAVKTSAQVERIVRADDGWRLQFEGAVDPSVFGIVVVAIPPAQATVLLQPHEGAWAAQLQSRSMHPTWTLMAVTGEPATSQVWNVARPPGGPLGMIVRNDRKPGRQAASRLAHWVMHATVAWSAAHVEADSAWVQSEMRDAFERWSGRAVEWKHSAVHRWRYAVAAPWPGSHGGIGPALWDAAAGIGACGDALGGGRVEGAWASGRALARAILSA